MIEEIVDTISANRNFIYAFEQEGTAACRIIEDSLCDVLMPSPSQIAFDDEFYYTEYAIPSIKQINDYYCGPASTLMALIGSGSSKYYYTKDTSITDKWQEDIAHELETGLGGTEIGKIIDVMNKYIKSYNNWEYRSKGFTQYGNINVLLTYIRDSICSDAVPILELFDTSYLNYYNGVHYEHYIIVEAIDFSNKELRVIDPNRISDDYFGVKYISFKELENTLLYSTFKDTTQLSGLWLATYTPDKLPPFYYIY